MKKENLQKEIADLEKNLKEKDAFTIQLDSNGNLSLTCLHFIDRILVESDLLSEPIYKMNSNLKKSKEMCIPLNLKAKSGNLDITLSFTRKENELILQQKQVFIPRFHYYHYQESFHAHQLPPLQVTLLWNQENPFDVFFY